MLGDVRKQAADFYSALTVLVERPWASHERPVVVELGRCYLEEFAGISAMVLS